MRTATSLAAFLLLVACDEPAPPAASGSATSPRTAPSPADPPAGRAAAPPASDAAAEPKAGPANWREVVSAADASRLGRLDQAWRLARAEAEDKGFAGEVEALGPLVDPNAGLAGRLQPAPGDYRCRTLKLGSNRPEGPGFVRSPWFRCIVELTPGGDLVLARTGGSQRTRGLLYPDTERRLVFVGAEAGGHDEGGRPAYGETPERDQVGVFERVGPGRWRLAIPWPRVESKLELLELVR